MDIQGLWEVFALGVVKVWGLTMIYLVAGVTAVFILDSLARRKKENTTR